MRAVALGGGHGLAATLGALRLMPEVSDVTAVVTVADDGGSSGRIRREIGGLLPPGDLRMALAALAHEPGWTELVQHRFGGTGALAGHAVGNLVLAGLMETLGDPVAALDAMCELLGVRGRVLPMCAVPLDIEAEVSGLDPEGEDAADAADAGRTHRIRGQVAVASTPGRVERVRLLPEDPPACTQAVEAVRAADLVLLGPGSWFTSVLPHLLVPALRAALQETAARRVVVLNLAPEPGETPDFSPEQHLAVLAAHAPELRFDVVLADSGSVAVPRRLRREAETMMGAGGRVHLAPVAAGPLVPRHEPTALAAALREVLSGPPGGPGAATRPRSGAST
ncbi:uridine diphosphate-N-acetylglucosamine-binding protein YvcK [Pseudonocardia ailaonensis]|uniref:Putative gluconeogenesis factor n=1 Tax=Pseudonocardia ailaonensis TaxID=367279 RepID=A0ABN2MMJ1_9PSEU